MLELRWKVEEWEEYRDGINLGFDVTEEPVLQYRTRMNIEEIGLHAPLWSEWEDVSTERIAV